MSTSFSSLRSDQQVGGFSPYVLQITGRRYSWGSHEQIQSIERIDKFIGDLRLALETNALGDNVLIVDVSIYFGLLCLLDSYR